MHRLAPDRLSKIGVSTRPLRGRDATLREDLVTLLYHYSATCRSRDLTRQRPGRLSRINIPCSASTDPAPELRWVESLLSGLQ
jgi:hypothetical protein